MDPHEAARKCHTGKSTLKRPVQIVKKRSGPLDEALAEVNDPGPGTDSERQSRSPTSPDEPAAAVSVAAATSASPSKFTSMSELEKVVAASAKSHHSPAPSRRKPTVKDKDKKRERWLLTRKTWKYMTDAGRRLIPEGVQNRKEDIHKIEAHFQHVCSAEPRFILWRRKLSYPGAGRQSKRRLKQLLQHTGLRHHTPEMIEQQEAHNADQVIDFLQSYLKIDEAYKTTTLLGTKTVRPDQTSSPSAQRPGSSSGSGVGGGYGNAASSRHLMAIGGGVGVGVGIGIGIGGGLQNQRKDIDILLQRLKALTASSSMRSVLPVTPDRITPALLEDKALLKQIYNSLKKQQLHRILSKHSDPPKTKANLKHSSSLSSLLYYNNNYSSGKDSKFHQYDTNQNQKLTTTIGGASHLPPLGGTGTIAAATATDRHSLKSVTSALPPMPTTTMTTSTTTPMPTLTSTPMSEANRRTKDTDARIGTGAIARQRKPPPTTLDLQGAPSLQKKKSAAMQKQFFTCGTQTNFIQLNEIKRLAEEYKEQKREEGDQPLSPSANDDDGGDKGGSHAQHHSRRKSSIDNEDVSQSVSDTIKRYLRMARKKSVHNDNANRFKRVNYDRNLRNIRAKGEINPPGMDDGNDKAVQTLDAWAVITLDFIRGKENSGILEEAHAEWSTALNERIQKKLEFEQKMAQSRLSGQTTTTTAMPPQTQSQSQKSHKQSASSCSSSSAPTSPITSPSYSSGGSGHGSSGGGGGSGILHTSSQFLSNLWHGTTSNPHPTHNQQYDPAAAYPNQGIDSKNAQINSTMQKSKSSSNVGQFVSLKILRQRSKSQTRPTSPLATSKWSPAENFTWTSENGDRIILLDASLLNLSDIEAITLQRVAVDKINELNVGLNLKLDNDTKSHKRRVLSKKKAMTTSIFDTGSKRDDQGSSLCIFGNSLECCVTNDKKKSNKLNSSSGDRGSKSSIASLFQRAGGGGGSSGGGNGSGSINSDTTKLNENVRSCESLPSDSSKTNTKSISSYFGNLAKSSSMQLSLSQFDVRRRSQEFEFDFSRLPLKDFNDKTDNYLQVPNFVTVCVKYLEDCGLNKIGLFRVSTSKKRVKQMREDFDKSATTRIELDTCPHDVATLLKEFLRDLPEPLLCSYLYKPFLDTQKIRNRRLQLEALSHLVKLLPAAHRDTLYVILKFLAKVASCSDDVISADGSIQMSGNKMDSNNLATVFAPNILRSSLKPGAGAGEEQEAMSDAINVIRTMIDHYEELFKVPAELIDAVYSHMMDESPEKLYYLCEQRSLIAKQEENKSPSSVASYNSEQELKSPPASIIPPIVVKPKKTYKRESVMHNNDASKAPDAIVNGPRTRASRSSHSKSRQRSSSSTLIDRRQSSPNVLDKSGVVSASLQISVPGQAQIKQPLAGNQFEESDLDEVFHDTDHSDIPFIEDSNNGQEWENLNKGFPISGSFSFSTKYEPPSSSSMIPNLQHSSTVTFGPLSDSLSQSVDPRRTANEPKLPTSISNIGGATLRSKTEDFERRSFKEKDGPSTRQSAPNNGSGSGSSVVHLYKRQELIPSAKSSASKTNLHRF